MGSPGAHHPADTPGYASYVASLDDTWLSDLLDRHLAGLPGALAVRGAVSADAERGCARRPGLFPIYSIAKTVIATCVVQLADEGALGLDDPLAHWHAEVPSADRCTLRQVLGHRAGLRDYGGLPSYHEALAASPGRAWTREEYADATWRQGLLFEPGRGFAYSNPGYRLLVEVLQQVTGRDLDEVVRVRVAERLGLATFAPLSTAADFADLEPGISPRLDREGTPRDVRTTMDPGWVFHRTFAASAADAAELVQGLAAGELVSADGLRAMTELVSIGHPSPPWTDPSYGLGLMGDPSSPFGPIWGHNGGGPGYTASAFHAPASPAGPVTVCALVANEQDGAAEAVLREVLVQLAA